MIASTFAAILNQSCSWQRQQSVDDRDNATYQIAESVPCRKVQQTKDVIGKLGEVVTTTWTVTLAVQPNVGDLIDGREVIQLDACCDWRGNVLGWRVRTR